MTRRGVRDRVYRAHIVWPCLHTSDHPNWRIKVWTSNSCLSHAGRRRGCNEAEYNRPCTILYLPRVVHISMVVRFNRMLGRVSLPQNYYTFADSVFSRRKRYRSRPRSPSATASPDAVPGVSILRPLKGLDANLYENIESTFTQEYPNYEIFLSVESEHDQALPVVRELMAKYPNVDAHVVIGGPLSLWNNCYCTHIQDG